VGLGSARNERHPELELTDAAVFIFWHYGRIAVIRCRCEMMKVIQLQQTLTN
jgi:hypothetical protein